MNAKTFRYVLVGGWSLLIAVLPFIVIDSLFFPFITGKNIFFRSIVDILLVLWIVSCIYDKALRPKWSWLLGIFAAFTVWVGIADMVGIDPLRSFWSNFERMEGYITLLHLFALFIISTVSITKDIWYKLIGWSVFISGCTWIQGMTEHLKDKNFRIDGDFGNPSYFAAYALIHIFFAIMLALRYRAYKYLWAAFALLNLWTISSSGTRGALMGVVGGIVVAAILYLICEWNNKKVRYVSLGVIGFIILAVVTLGLARNTDFIAKSPVLSRFGQLAGYVITFDIKGLFEDIGRSRVAIWNIAWEGAKDNPVLGYGQDNFIQVFSTHYDPGIFDQEQWFDRTHNVFLDWLIAAGFVGLLGYLGIFAAMLWYLWKRNVFELYEKIAITGLCVAYFIHTFFVFDNITSYIFIMFVWVLVHHTVTTTEVVHEKKKHKEKDPENVAAIIMGGIVLAVLAAWFINSPVYSTAKNLSMGYMYSSGDGIRPSNEPMLRESLKYFENALAGADLAKIEINEQLVGALGRIQASTAATSTKIAFINLITAQVERTVADHPIDARVNYFAGVYYSSVGDLQKSIGYLNKALTYSPGKQTMMFLLADSYRRSGDVAKSLEIYKQAFELDTSFVEPRLRYVEALLSVNKKAEAEALIIDLPPEALNDVRFVNLLLAVNRYDIIVTIFENELKRDPNNMQNRISLAAAYAEIGKKDEAIIVLETIKRDVPQSKDQIDKFISDIKAGRKTF